MKKLLIALLMPICISLTSGAYAEKNTPTKVNINSASAEELDQNLKGVGKNIALEIVKHRDNNGPFKSLLELDKVKYIGPSLIKKNKSIIDFK